MSELEASETVNYLATLESKVAHRDEQAREQARAIRAQDRLRTLQRQQSGRSGTGKEKGRRPSTAGARIRGADAAVARTALRATAATQGELVR